MKTCLVGCGGIAAVHGSVLTSDIDTEFVAAADIKPEKAQTYAENFHTKPYPSLESMLEAEKPDVLHICTPHYLHVPMAIYSLERNINVFMEKPPAISFDQLEELKKAAAKSEAQLGFCYQNRYNASIRAAKDLIDSGKAGKVLGARAFVTWCRGAAYYTESGWRGSLKTEGGGVLINQSVHTQDLLCFLLGNPTTVDATMTNHHLKNVIEVEDTLEAYIDFNGVHASLLCDDLLLRRRRTADRNRLRKYDNPRGRPARHGISQRRCALSAFRRNAAPDRQELLGHSGTPHAFRISISHCATTGAFA